MSGGDDRDGPVPEWLAPEPLAEPQEPLPECPTDALGPWEGWCRDQAEAASAPVDFVVMSLLVAAGATIANTRWGSPHSGWREPPVLNVGLVGLPSSGKSPALDMVMGPLRTAEHGLGENFEKERQNYEIKKKEVELKLEKWDREAKAAIDKKHAPPEMPADAVMPREPRAPRLFATNATVEALIDILECEPKGIVLVNDELAGHIGNMDKYGGKGGDRAFHLEAYGGRSYTVDRVKNGGAPVRVSHLSIAYIGGIQPDRLKSMLISGDDDGFAARYIYVQPKPVPLKRHVPQPEPEQLVRAIMVLRALEMDKGKDTDDTYPKSVPFTDAAADVLHSYRQRVRDAEQYTAGMFCGWIGKNPGRVVRIACILEHLWWAWRRLDEPAPSEISGKAALAATRFVEDYLTPHAERVFNGAGHGEDKAQDAKDAELLALWVKDWMGAKGEPPTLKDAAQYAPYRLRNKARRRAAIALLSKKHWLRVEERAAKSIFSLNPQPLRKA